MVQWLGLRALTVEGPGVRSLVGELRSHKLPKKTLNFSNLKISSNLLLTVAKTG